MEIDKPTLVAIYWRRKSQSLKVNEFCSIKKSIKITGISSNKRLCLSVQNWFQFFFFYLQRIVHPDSNAARPFRLFADLFARVIKRMVRRLHRKFSIGPWPQFFWAPHFPSHYLKTAKLFFVPSSGRNLKLHSWRSRVPEKYALAKSWWSGGMVLAWYIGGPRFKFD